MERDTMSRRHKWIESRRHTLPGESLPYPAVGKIPSCAPPQTRELSQTERNSSALKNNPQIDRSLTFRLTSGSTSQLITMVEERTIAMSILRCERLNRLFLLLD
jgi:hypothetical protein